MPAGCGDDRKGGLVRILGMIFLVAVLAARAGAQELSDELRARIAASTAFFVYHELGHALIERMALPVRGREEDAADALGVVLAEHFKPAEEAATVLLSAAATFAGMAGDKDAADDGFQALHARDRQRQYNILCLHFGADPAARRTVADAGGLPAAHRPGCPARTERLRQAWAPLIARLHAGGSDHIWLRLRVIEAPVDPLQRAMLRALRDELRRLNRLFDPGFRLIATFARCGEANAFYDPADGNITFCAELARLFDG